MMLIIFSINLNIATFMLNDSIYSLEIYYSIPYRELNFHEKDSVLQASYSILLTLMNHDTLSKRFDKKAIIPSFTEAEKRKLEFSDYLQILVEKGSYVLRLLMNSGDREDTLIRYINIKHHENGPVVSTPVLCSYVGKEGGIKKGDISILPSPSAVFGKDRRTIWVYFEVYNMDKGGSAYYEITKDTSSILYGKIGNFSNKKSAAVFAIDSYRLEPGEYTLTIYVKDDRGYDYKDVKFSIEERGKLTSLDSLYLEYWYIVPILDKDYGQRIQRVSDYEKLFLLRKFWKDRDFLLYKKRADIAKERYRYLRESGYATAMGKIFIKNGEPDDIIKKEWESSKGYDIVVWQYYNSGYKYIFIDDGTGNYKLILSNDTDIPPDVHWSKYIDRQTLEEIGGL